LRPFTLFFNGMKKISNWPGWVVSLVFLLVCYFVVNSDFIGTEYVKQVSGGAAILDTFFYYPSGQVFALLTALGEAGRSAYLTLNLLDFLFPISYALFFGISLTMTYTFIYPPESKRNWLILLPFITLLVDYGENICVRLMLVNYPAQIPWAAQTASLLTPLKFTLIVICALLILQGNMKVTNKLYRKK
jgi:hypothetical protein